MIQQLTKHNSINYISPAHSRVKPSLIYAFFITVDVISLALQAAGGAMSSTSDGASQTGVNIALAGLAFQVATLAFFVTFVIDYAWRSRSVWVSFRFPLAFKIFVASLSLATLLIWIRCCYRVYELSEGYSQYSEALRDEPLFIGLESVMVVVAAYALIVAHPGPVFERGRAAEGPAAMQKIMVEEKTRRAVGAGSSEEESSA